MRAWLRCRAVCVARSGHQSFSNNKSLNDLVGNIVHSSILVPYHGWRVSHRTHHANHGHVENDESWHPVTKKLYDSMVSPQLTGLPRSISSRVDALWSLLTNADAARDHMRYPERREHHVPLPCPQRLGLYQSW